MIQKTLNVGIPKEIKPGEYRVAGLPEHVRKLRDMGSVVVVQRGAGVGSGAEDDDYRKAGAELVDGIDEVYARADVLWKVKEILPQEYGLIRAEQVIFTYLHASPRPEMTRVLRDSGCISIAYEEMTDDVGRRPLLVPMSRLAGAGAIAVSAQFTQVLYGGCGKLLFCTESAEPVTVTILGMGVAGRAAAQAALGAGAKVHMLDVAAPLLAELKQTFPSGIPLVSNEATIRRLLPETDILVNCTMWMPGDPALVTRSMISLMKRGSLIMDVSADPHGGIETSEQTTHENPIRVVDGILHYCVQNIPSLFASTASKALGNVTWPHLQRLVQDGVDEAIKTSAMLRRAVVIWRGKVVGKNLGRMQGISTIEPDDLLHEIAAGVAHRHK